MTLNQKIAKLNEQIKENKGLIKRMEDVLYHDDYVMTEEQFDQYKYLKALTKKLETVRETLMSEQPA